MNHRISRLLLASVVTAVASFCGARDPALLRKLQKTEGYEQFVLRVKKTDHTTKRFFELYETPAPPIAGKDIVERYVLIVKDNKARTDQIRGKEADPIHYTTIFDGEKTLRYRVAKTLPGDRKVIRATEDSKNMLEWSFWRALARDEATLRYRWKIPPTAEKIAEENSQIVLRIHGEGDTTIRYDAKPPYSYLGELHTNAAGKMGREIIVTKRFTDGFPQEVKMTSTILNEPVGWTIYTIIERRPGLVNDALFKVTPAAGSFISRNDEDWIYIVGADGERSKFAHVSTGRPVGFLARLGVVLVAGAGASCTGLLFLAYRRTHRRASRT